MKFTQSPQITAETLDTTEFPAMALLLNPRSMEADGGLTENEMLQNMLSAAGICQRSLQENSR